MKDNLTFGEQLAEWRHQIHQHPETAFEEECTSEFVADQLERLGLEVYRNIGKTGIVANLKVGNGKKVIGLRADMDAINLQEESGKTYASEYKGKMHGCGHDGHTVTLLGAAMLLAKNKHFNGTVRFIFQPAEEPGQGALAMMSDKILERFPMDEIYGFHNSPLIQEGKISTKVGGMMASEDDFVIRIKGQGGHSSSPHNVKDPVVIGAEIIMALQTIVSRNVNPEEAAVISVTEIHTDGARNCIPSTVTISGDTRSFSSQTQMILESKMRELCEAICKMNGAELEFTYNHEFIPLINDRECTKLAGKAAANIVGTERVNLDGGLVMASEDFARFLQKIPGCYVNIGGKCDEEQGETYPLHNAQFDYNDRILEIGAKYLEEVVRVSMPEN